MSQPEQEIKVQQPFKQDLKDAMISNLECPICFNLFKKPVTIQCGHNYCAVCIDNQLKQTPKCPVCREVIIRRPDGYRENTLIKAMVEELRKSGFKENLDTPLIQQQPEVAEHSSSHIILLSNSFIIPYIYQRVQLDRAQFQNLTNQQISSFLYEGQIIITKSIPNGNTQTGVLAQVQQIISTNKGNFIQAQVLSIERIEFTQAQQQTFEVGEENRVSFQMPVAHFKIMKDDPIDLMDPEINQQVHNICESIIIFLDRLFLQQGQQLDQTSMMIHQQLSRSGLFNLLQRNSIDNMKSLKRLSFLLPGMLKLPMEDKQRIVGEMNIIQRLLLIQNGLKRFEGISNPLLIFNLDGENKGQSSITKELMVTMIIIVILYLLYKY